MTAGNQGPEWGVVALWIFLVVMAWVVVAGTVYAVYLVWRLLF